MPYVPNENERRTKLASGELEPEVVGDLNFLWTLEILKDFKVNPRYATVHEIYKKYVFGLGLVMPKKWLNKFNEVDIAAAAHLAYNEFSDRIVRYYEDKCIAKNTDLKEYIEVFKIIEGKE